MNRVISLLSINDCHTIDLTDNGVDRDGIPTSSRQNVTLALTKRVDVEGKKLPVFRVASVGPWQSARPLSGDEFAALGDFDERYLEPSRLEGMSEKLASEWSTERSKRIEKSAERRRQAEAEVERARSGDVANAITAMVRSLESKTATTGTPRPSVRGVA